MNFLIFLKWLIKLKKLNIATYLFLFYSEFVVLKSLFGYYWWGPLSLRHAALFYYPLFAVFSYSFYRGSFFGPNKVLPLIFLNLFNFVFFSYYPHFVLVCFALTLILINAYPKKIIRRSLYFLLLITFPYKLLFITSKTLVISNALALLYMGFGFLYILNLKRKFKCIIFILLISFILYGITAISYPIVPRTLIGFKKIVSIYNKNIELLRINEKGFIEPELIVKLYNEKNVWFQKFGHNRIMDSLKSPISLSQKESGSPDSGDTKHKPVSILRIKEESKNIVQQKSSDELALTIKKGDVSNKSAIENKSNIVLSTVIKASTEYENQNKTAINRIKVEVQHFPPWYAETEASFGNSLFRIFVWQEALKQIAIARPIFGFDFGKPFRSRTCEVLEIAKSEWMNVGWLCMHNSYIDIVYRAGIMGILMIMAILITLFFSIKYSFKNRSLTGILLTGILIHGFISANFLEILEMPYTSIPLWSLFGLTFAYLFKNSRS